MSMSNQGKKWVLVGLVLAMATSWCAAQELVPRRWSHLPINKNFGGVGYVYTEADIYLDPVLLAEDVTMNRNSMAISYIRSFELLGKSARVDFTQAYHDVRWQGLVDGQPTTVRRNGLGDTALRMAVNLYGAPPLEGMAYKKYRESVYDCETVVACGLAVHLPTGHYNEDRLMNIGSNRFTFRPQLGIVHQRGPWSFETTGSLWFYSDNDDFWNGNELESDPLFAVQGHVVYTFKPGLWTSVSCGYGYGSEATVNGIEKNNTGKNMLWAWSVGYSLTRELGVKCAYVGSETLTEHGFDSHSFAVSLSYVW